MELVQALKHYKHVPIPLPTQLSAEDLNKTQDSIWHLCDAVLVIQGWY